MKKLIKYIRGKTYMFPNGAIATPDAILEQFPAIEAFAHVIETDENEEVLWSVINLSAMRSMYQIDPELDEAGAIDALQEIINTPPPEPEQVDDPLATALSALAEAVDNLTVQSGGQLGADEVDWVKGLIAGVGGLDNE